MAAAIKGLAIAALVEDLAALLRDGTVARSDLEKQLDAGQLALVEGEFEIKQLFFCKSG